MRGVALLSLLPVVLTLWLLSGPAGMIEAGMGAGWAGWIFRGALVAVSSVLFWPVAWLSGRYVLSAATPAAGPLRLSVWTLWGRREVIWPGLLERAPFAGEGDGAGRWSRVRALLQPVVRELVGHRGQLWPGGPTLYEGRTHIPGRVWVDAPYISLRPILGRGLIIDMQGEFPGGFEAFVEAVGRP